MAGGTIGQEVGEILANASTTGTGYVVDANALPMGSETTDKDSTWTYVAGGGGGTPEITALADAGDVVAADPSNPRDSGAFVGYRSDRRGFTYSIGPNKEQDNRGLLNAAERMGDPGRYVSKQTSEAGQIHAGYTMRPITDANGYVIGEEYAPADTQPTMASSEQIKRAAEAVGRVVGGGVKGTINAPFEFAASVVKGGAYLLSQIGESAGLLSDGATRRLIGELEPVTGRMLEYRDNFEAVGGILGEVVGPSMLAKGIQLAATGARTVVPKIATTTATLVDEFAARQTTAREFYQAAGWDETRIKAHLQGIDFSKPVEVITLSKGTLVDQYQVSGKAVGNYFSPIGTPPEVRGMDLTNRVQGFFELREDVKVLKSTAQTIPDWLNSGQVFRGGGTQFFAPNHTNFLRIAEQ